MKLLTEKKKVENIKLYYENEISIIEHRAMENIKSYPKFIIHLLKKEHSTDGQISPLMIYHFWLNAITTCLKLKLRI